MESRPIGFVSDGHALQGTLALPGNLPAAAVVLCHGFGSHGDDTGAYVRTATRLATVGIASLRFSFSGSHPYPDHGTIQPASHWVHDCLAAVARLQTEPGIDPARLGLMGMSVGGGVVVQAAALCPQVRCVVSLAPVADGEAWLRHRWLTTRGEAAWHSFVAEVEADRQAVVQGRASRVVAHFDVQALPNEAEWKHFLVRCPQILERMTLASVWDTFCFKPVYYAQAMTQPLRIVHGDADESVPLEHGRRFFEHAAGPKELCVVPGAPHCCWDTPLEEEVQRLSVQWLEQHLT